MLHAPNPGDGFPWGNAIGRRGNSRCKTGQVHRLAHAGLPVRENFELDRRFRGEAAIDQAAIVELIPVYIEGALERSVLYGKRRAIGLGDDGRASVPSH